MEVKATLIPCPSCRKPLVVIDGKPNGPVTFFSRGGQFAMTPHTDDCEFRGKDTPKES